jgi:chromosome segregation ATPase
VILSRHANKFSRSNLVVRGVTLEGQLKEARESLAEEKRKVQQLRAELESFRNTDAASNLEEVKAFKALNEEVLDLLEKEKAQSEKLKSTVAEKEEAMRILRTELQTEQGSHSYTLQQLDEERRRTLDASKFVEELRGQLEAERVSMTRTVERLNEKVARLQDTLENLRADKEGLENQLQEVEAAKASAERVSQEERERAKAAQEVVDRLTKHVRELKAAPKYAIRPICRLVLG